MFDIKFFRFLMFKLESGMVFTNYNYVSFTSWTEFEIIEISRKTIVDLFFLLKLINLP